MLWFYVAIKKLEIDKPDSCLKAFKSNNLIGFVVFVNLIVGKLRKSRLRNFNFNFEHSVIAADRPISGGIVFSDVRLSFFP